MKDLSCADSRKRLGAFLIDFIILYLINILLIGFFSAVANIALPKPSLSNPLAITIVWIIFVITGWIYFALTESSRRQATIGKRLLKLIVTDLEGNKITFRKATARFWGKVIVAPTFSLTILMGKKKALHDMAAGTLVINNVRLPYSRPE